MLTTVPFGWVMFATTADTILESLAFAPISVMLDTMYAVPLGGMRPSTPGAMLSKTIILEAVVFSFATLSLTVTL